MFKKLIERFVLRRKFKRGKKLLMIVKPDDLHAKNPYYIARIVFRERDNYRKKLKLNKLKADLHNVKMGYEGEDFANHRITVRYILEL